MSGGVDLENENFRLRMRLFELENGHTTVAPLQQSVQVQQDTEERDVLLARARDVVKRLEGELTASLAATTAAQAALQRSQDECRSASATAKAEAAGRRALEAECEVLRG